jgi:hypothetical protein
MRLGRHASRSGRRYQGRTPTLKKFYLPGKVAVVTDKGRRVEQVGQSGGRTGVTYVNIKTVPLKSHGTSPSAPSSPERPTGNHVFWIKDTEHPVGTRPRPSR